MGLEIAKAKVPGSPPNMSELLEACRRLSSLELSVAGMSVAFDFHPTETVDVELDAENRRATLFHMAGEAPALMALLEHALLSLGGTFTHPVRAISLPLSREGVDASNREIRQKLRNGAAFVFAVFALAACALVAAVGGAVYLVWRLFA